MTFGQNLRQARERLNLSQEAAAKLIEKNYRVRLSAAYLSMIENGVKTNLTVNLLNALLAYFHLPLHAAASLFIIEPLAEYERQETIAAIKETADEYPAEDALPEEARQALQEFKDFLCHKYKKRKAAW